MYIKLLWLLLILSMIDVIIIYRCYCYLQCATYIMPLSFLAESTAYRAFKTLLRISCDGKGWQPCQVSIPTILSALSCFAHQNLWLSPPRRENKIIAFLICLGLKFLQPSWINVLQASGKRSLPNLIPYLAMLIIGNPPSASKDHHGSPWLLDLCSSFQHFHAKVHQLAEDLAWLKWVALLRNLTFIGAIIYMLIALVSQRHSKVLGQSPQIDKTGCK